MGTLFFIASKLGWALIAPASWLILGPALALWALLRGRGRLGRWLLALSLAFGLAIGFLPFGDLLIRPLETRYPVAPALTRVDGIIVLGGGEDGEATTVWGAPQLNGAGERFSEALALARRFPDARIVFTGGSGALQGLALPRLSGAEVARRFFARQGLDMARLTLESDSRNTAENAAMSLALVGPKPGETWVLVTSGFHMPRAMRSFVRAGWPGLVAWPVDFRSAGFAYGIGWDLVGHLDVLQVALRERIGLLVYGLTGR